MPFFVCLRVSDSDSVGFQIVAIFGCFLTKRTVNDRLTLLGCADIYFFPNFPCVDLDFGNTV